MTTIFHLLQHQKRKMASINPLLKHRVFCVGQPCQPVYQLSNQSRTNQLYQVRPKIQAPNLKEWELTNRKCGSSSVCNQLWNGQGQSIMQGYWGRAISSESHLSNKTPAMASYWVVALTHSCHGKWLLLPWQTLIQRDLTAPMEKPGTQLCLNAVLKWCFAFLNYLWVDAQWACNITITSIVFYNIAEECKVPCYGGWAG